MLFRVRLRGVDNAVDARAGMNYLMVDGPAGNEAQWRNAFEFKVDRPYTNLQEVLARMNTIAGVVTNYIRTYGLQNGGGAFYRKKHPPKNIQHFRASNVQNLKGLESSKFLGLRENHCFCKK